MKIIGSNVNHKIFGKGTVLALTDKIITVKFAKGVKDFEYPEAFETFLSSDNKDIQKQALKLAEESKRRKEEEARQTEELRIKRQESLKAQKSATTRAPAAPKYFKRENAAFKCTYCDGGKGKNSIGFKGVCSKENIGVNITSGRNWCLRSACRDYYDGEITRKELTEKYKDEGLCYECRTLLDWKFSVGWTEPEYDENGEIIKESKPKRINKMMPGSLAVLTTRFPNSSEEERVIFAVFLVDDSYDGDDFEEGFVTADPTYRLAFTTEEASELLYWNFYRNSGNTEKAHWGTGLFRYISDEIAVNILKRASEIKRGTKDEKSALKFFEHFCETHGIDSENLPECEGALKIKS